MDQYFCDTWYNISLHKGDLERGLLKSFLRIEKMLVSRIFYFSLNVFYPIKEKLHHFSHFEIGRGLQELSIWTTR